MTSAGEPNSSLNIEESWSCVRRKTFKKMFEFNLMILGPPGIGKTTLIRELYEFELVDCAPSFRAESHFLYHIRKHTNQDTHFPPVSVRSQAHELDRGRLKIKLNIIEAPMLGEALNSQNCWDPISEYIDSKFEDYLAQESSINRRNIIDNRVHCVLYLIDTSKRKLTQLDIEVMKSISNKCNILPVLAKVDMVDPTDLIQIKHDIRKQLEEEQILLYPFPDYDEEESEEFNNVNEFLKTHYPLSVISGGSYSPQDGNYVRVYPWGTLITNSPKMSNVNVLKTILRKTHVNDFKDITQQIHYENYRSWRLSGSNPDQRDIITTRNSIM